MSTKTINSNLPSIRLEDSLASYLTQIKKFPILEAKEEYMLAKNWRNRGDLKSAQKLITSHLRLVAKIAMGYRGYGLPVSEIVAGLKEGLNTAFYTTVCGIVFSLPLQVQLMILKFKLDKDA